MELGISTAAFYGNGETEDAARRIAALPVSCAEVFLQTPSEYCAQFGSQVRSLLSPVRCTSVHPYGSGFETAMAGQSARQHKDALDTYRRVLEAGAALGAKYYVYHGRCTTQHRVLEWNLPLNLELLSEMSRIAGEFGMKPAWENVCWCQLTVPERVREARKACPELCFTLDIKQAMRAGADPFEMADAMGGGLVNVHLCDWRQDGTLCLPGEGSFDFGGFFARLKKNGFAGPVILEPYLRLISGQDALDASLRFLREKLDAAENGAE